MNRPTRTAAWVAALVVTLPLVGCSDTSPPDETYADPSTNASSTATEPAEPIDGLFEIGDGRSLYVRCTGSGSPTVILEAGDDDPSASYDFAVPAVSAVTRTCVYDRANLGRSDPDPGPRGLAELVVDFENLIEAADIPGPYVLVGTSGGGYISAGYAVEHPEQVAGMVFVEVPAPFWNPPQEIVEATRWDSPVNVENRDYLQVEKDAWAARRRIGDIPVTVISNEYSPEEIAAAEFPEEAAGMPGNVQAQRGWLVLSPLAEQLVVHTGHAVEEADPDLVRNAILDVVETARIEPTSVPVGTAAQGATTPGSNGKIVFSADLGQGFQLFTIEPNGDGFHQLTNVDREASRADWSPNGNRLAFELFELSDGEHAGVAIMNADGSDLVDLTPTGINTEPAWTPDGKQLVYECFTCVGGDGIFVINEDGTGSRRLTNNPFPDGFDTDPNVSPDGQTVTFVRVRKDGREQALFAVDLDGGNERKLTSFGLQVGVKHDWAPDGRHIVITQDADYPHGRSPNVATIRPDGSQLRMLTTYEDGKRGAFAGSYSPDGRWIVFRVENLDRQTFRLLKIRPDGSHRTLIATLPFAPRNIEWGSK